MQTHRVGARDYDETGVKAAQVGGYRLSRSQGDRVSTERRVPLREALSWATVQD